MSVGEMLVRSNLVAARTLNALDGKEYYRNIVGARIGDSGLEIIIAGVEGPLSEDTAAAMEHSGLDAQQTFNNAVQPVNQRRAQVQSILETIQNRVMHAPHDGATYNEIQQQLQQLRGLAVVNVSINLAEVYADNTRLRHEAQQLVAHGELAAEPVIKYLDRTLQAATTTTGRIWKQRVPVTGIESRVRGYFFLHNLLKGEAWGLIFTDSGFLLLEGKAYEKALQELQAARSFVGYDTLDVRRGIGIAHKELGHVDDAIAAFSGVVDEYPYDPIANNALSEIFGEKSNGKMHILDMAELKTARNLLSVEAIEAAALSPSEKASQLYMLGCALAYLEPTRVANALKPLRKSLALEPRAETYAVLSDLHARLPA